MVVEIPLPKKFDSLLNHEEERYHKLSTDAGDTGDGHIVPSNSNDSVNSIEN
jgi:hypothetical protein